MAFGLPSLQDRVRRLQTSLQAKAKAEPAYRFYTLWDKVCRPDVLAEAYRRCRANRGAPGVDDETFAAIEAQGVEAWLERLRQELCARAYRPQPLLRVWIPKSSGGQRPLGIPTIRDRVVQAAMVIVLEPIFEVDLLPNQYGFRGSTPRWRSGAPIGTSPTADAPRWSTPMCATTSGASRMAR